MQGSSKLYADDDGLGIAGCGSDRDATDEHEIHDEALSRPMYDHQQKLNNDDEKIAWYLRFGREYFVQHVDATWRISFEASIRKLILYPSWDSAYNVYICMHRPSFPSKFRPPAALFASPSHVFGCRSSSPHPSTPHSRLLFSLLKCRRVSVYATL